MSEPVKPPIYWAEHAPLLVVGLVAVVGLFVMMGVGSQQNYSGLAGTSDTTPPSINITSPLNNAFVFSPFTIDVSASDDVAIAFVQFFSDGNSIGIDNSSPYSMTASLTPGQHALTAFAMDTSGNGRGSSTVTIYTNSSPVCGNALVESSEQCDHGSANGACPYTCSASCTLNNCAPVDTTPPQVTIIDPVDGQQISAPYYVTASVSDAGGISQVDFFVDGLLFQNSFAPPYTVMWYANGYPVGKYVLTAKATDTAGNVGTSAPITVDRIDVCYDSDGGINGQVFGTTTVGNMGQNDYCDFYYQSNNVVVEGYCTSNITMGRVNVTCSGSTPYCRFGACSSIPPQCTDTDGGVNINVNGTVTVEYGQTPYYYTDYCQVYANNSFGGDCTGEGCTVREFSCSGLSINYGDYSCPNGCTNGKCAAATDTTAPTISSVDATSSLGAGMYGTVPTITVTWNTDELADSVVTYGTSSSALTVTAQSPSLVTAHSITLGTGSGVIMPSTTYYYKVSSTDAAGNRVTTIPTYSIFSVANPADTTPPVLSKPLPSGTLSSSTKSVTLRVTTNENSKCRYSTTPGVAYASMTKYFSTTTGLAHTASISSLADGASYNYYVRCQDTAGNANTADLKIAFSISLDTTPPTVSVTAPKNNANGAVNTTITLSASASDNRAVAGVQFYVNGVKQFSEDTSSPYSRTWKPLVAGTYTITATARDARGNTKTSLPVTVLIK